MICPNKACNAEFRDGLLYCPSCGRLLDPSSAYTGRPPVDEETRRRVMRRRVRLLGWLAAILASSAATAAGGYGIYRYVMRPRPPMCPDHKGVILQDGVCQKKCNICGKHLKPDGTCEDICKDHPGIHLQDGACPKKCDICGKHLKPGGTCEDICKDHPGIHLLDGACPKKCDICGKHLEKDGTCADICKDHPGVHLQNGKCSECEKKAAEVKRQTDIAAAISKALESFRAEKWQEGMNALKQANVPESAMTNSELQYWMGYCYHRGYGGVDQNGAEMMRWYRKSAEQGFAKGQYRYGEQLALGNSSLRVLSDVREAKKWLREAEKQGIVEATRLLKDLEKSE